MASPLAPAICAGCSPTSLPKPGSPAPGTGTTFNGSTNHGFQSLRFNSAGQVAFFGYLNGPSDTNTGLFVGTPGNLSLLVRSGDVLPGMPAGATLGSPSTPVLGDSGVVALYGSIYHAGQGPDTGMWAGTPGNLRAIAFRGTHPPGTPPATLFTSFQSPLVDERGDVVFMATVNGPFGEGIWAAPALGPLELLVAEGQSVQVAPNDVRIVAQLDRLPGTFDDIGRSALSNSGELVVNVGFTDGSWAVAAFTVPTPGSAGCFLAAGALFQLRRRSRVASIRA